MADTWKWPPSGAVRSHCLFITEPGSANLVKMLAPLAKTAVCSLSPRHARLQQIIASRSRDVASVVGDVRVRWIRSSSDYVVVGWSGGGPHALACAALDAPRCLPAWSLASVVPTNLNFDWTEGMGPEKSRSSRSPKKAVPNMKPVWRCTATHSP